jgi:hypothetical protein
MVRLPPAPPAEQRLHDRFIGGLEDPGRQPIQVTGTNEALAALASAVRDEGIQFLPLVRGSGDQDHGVRTALSASVRHLQRQGQFPASFVDAAGTAFVALAYPEGARGLDWERGLAMLGRASTQLVADGGPSRVYDLGVLTTVTETDGGVTHGLDLYNGTRTGSAEPRTIWVRRMVTKKKGLFGREDVTEEWRGIGKT